LKLTDRRLRIGSTPILSSKDYDLDFVATNLNIEASSIDDSSKYYTIMLRARLVCNSLNRTVISFSNSRRKSGSSAFSLFNPLLTVNSMSLQPSENGIGFGDAMERFAESSSDEGVVYLLVDRETVLERGGDR